MALPRPGPTGRRHHRPRATVLSARQDKPITTLATSITNQDGLVVLDGTAVVWRDPTVTADRTTPPSAGAPAPTQEEST